MEKYKILKKLRTRRKMFEKYLGQIKSPGCKQGASVKEVNKTNPAVR
ncbi:hypothetical protein L9W92_00015 [Pelotomaculum terephthalicicum JT]|nr:MULTISPECIES: hypothetical protein [Pelotomaculum]MCG9966441.1 hypothetical protein [Pelotomaculum terephthalicicum JT]OPX89895.1 MAG: hypothetical protein A4E54_00793 [Pelotomaculum sp. PtaB.Bin117]OPY63418.1 MAG: hypothetical protein A4E56_00640 [Pelotomaculum sp. PtaU1.Bin065]